MGIYTHQYCPYCKAQLSFDIGVGADTVIGPRYEKCSQCNKSYGTGRSEWVEKSTIQKSTYYLRVIWWILGGVFYIGAFGLITGGIFAFLATKTGADVDFGQWVMYGGLFGVILSPILYIRKSINEINNSIARSSKKQ